MAVEGRWGWRSTFWRATQSCWLKLAISEVYTPWVAWYVRSFSLDAIIRFFCLTKIATTYQVLWIISQDVLSPCTSRGYWLGCAIILSYNEHKVVKVFRWALWTESGCWWWFCWWIAKWAGSTDSDQRQPCSQWSCFGSCAGWQAEGSEGWPWWHLGRAPWTCASSPRSLWRQHAHTPSDRRQTWRCAGNWHKTKHLTNCTT